jgi:hypothetical protein
MSMNAQDFMPGADIMASIRDELARCAAERDRARRSVWWRSNPSRIALKGSEGFLLIPLSKNFFELPATSQALDYKAHIEPMVAEMAALLATAALVRKAGTANGDAETE